MSSLITVLLHASASMEGLAGETNNQKIVGQLVMVRMTFVDLAFQLRDGKISIPNNAVETCVKEIEEARVAALAAAGSKDDGKYSLVIVEGNEAIAVIHSNAIPRNSPTGSNRAFALSNGTQSLPIPPDGPLPFPWPPGGVHPFPWPPRWPHPWPWPPGPWNPDAFNGLDGPFGYPRNGR